MMYRVPLPNVNWVMKHFNNHQNQISVVLSATATALLRDTTAILYKQAIAFFVRL
ncbi:hypothetical protein [Fischerella sp. PCC 9605]|uniref:hypothetical protein n=1 Tax=Fischerella sp. PCC 9605 TaxID=1173024 RepID=UPI0012DDB955|nr:hypothetical protein [Fischerella sp. PCC 9605]